MNFFEHQEQARRHTTQLVVWFILAVIGIIAALYVIFSILYAGMYGPEASFSANLAGGVDWWNPGLLAVTALGAAAIVGFGSLSKSLSLRGGGSVVAEGMGGRLIDQDTNDAEERKVLNVVEEMAIASGTPVPSVYLLEQQEGINAFAAGYTPDDAVIGVTRGTVQLLSRQELQGVIAHEFSHILNGDMRFNIRLIGIVYGILLIGILGRLVMYGGGYGVGRSDRGNRGAIMIAGLALFLVGSIGFLFGRIIKSAVSRQREYLADASAVQYTRNPDGIAGALKKIGGYTYGSAVESPKTEENSHLFFGNALGSSFFGGAFATHPPLEKRVRRIDPSFEGEFPEIEGSAVGAASAMGLHGSHFQERDSAKQDPSNQVTADNITSQVGALTPAHMAYGEELRKALPEKLLEAAHDPFSAEAVIYGLLLDEADEEHRRHQHSIMEERLSPELLEEIDRLYPKVKALDARLRLPILDVTAPALRRHSPRQYADFSNTIEQLVEADEELTVFEFAVQTIVQRRLEHSHGQRTERVRFKRAKAVEEDVIVLTAALAMAGHPRQEQALEAFHAGLRAWPRIGESAGQYQMPQPSKQALTRALARLEQASPRIKQHAIDAGAHCVLHDEEVTIQEAELLRATAVAMDCPLPPFLPTVQTAP